MRLGVGVEYKGKEESHGAQLKALRDCNKRNKQVNNLIHHYGMDSVPPKIHVEVLTPHVTVFGDRAFKDVIRFNETIMVEPQSARTGVLPKEEEMAERSPLTT